MHIYTSSTEFCGQYTAHTLIMAVDQIKQMKDYSPNSEGPPWGWGAGQEVGRDGGEVKEDRKLMFQQDTQSPGEKEEADLCEDLIQGYPHMLIVHAIWHLS